MGLFLGYHGTREDIANNILRTNFHIKNEVKPWLGSGIYFFEENQELAKNWANERYRGKRTRVLECLLEVPDDKVLDLVDPRSEHNTIFQAQRTALIESLNGKLDVLIKNNEDFDSKTLNVMCPRLGYLLVRAATYTYTDFDRRHKMKSKVPNGIELCLRDKAYIIEKEII